jgi:hypothetical protein
MKAEFPDFTREKLRSLLARLSRKDVLRRLERGVYLKPSWWEGDEVGERRDDDPEHDRWLERYERRRLACSTALFVHYLLPHLRSYRKAKALNLSERTYYYRIGEAIEDLELMVSAWRSGRQYALAAAARRVQS